jgi:predicted nucleic acid-binding Zn ribbon protein
MALHRRSPRSLSLALTPLRDAVIPDTLLAQVQACWPAVVGETIAREAEAVAERNGTITVLCSSSMWVQELNLISTDIVARLNRSLPRARVSALRCTAADRSGR